MNMLFALTFYLQIQLNLYFQYYTQMKEIDNRHAIFEYPEKHFNFVLHQPINKMFKLKNRYENLNPYAQLVS